jgi:hypothetical protein
MGRAYLVLQGLHGHSGFDNHLLPENLLIDSASKDWGDDYAKRLAETRAYLAEKHPMSHYLAAIADIPGETLDLNPFMRIEAQSLRTSSMELAFVSTGVPRQGDQQNRVLYFDTRVHAQGLSPVTVNINNALYDLLMFPLIHETGRGGFFKAKDGSSVKSRSGVKLTLQHYARSMIFQNARLHYLGRLSQEYALVQYSRMVEETLSFQRSGKVQMSLKRRRDLHPVAGQKDSGSRVGITTSVVGSKGSVKFPAFARTPIYV